MMQIEEFLDEAISDEPPTVAHDWDRVLKQASTLERRRSSAYKTAALALVVLVVGAAVSVFGGGDVLTNPATPEVRPPIGGDSQIWPSAGEVFDASGLRPSSPFIFSWIVAFGPALFAGWLAWHWAPFQFQGSSARPQWKRATLATAAALAAVVATAVVVGGLLFFTYDPSAAQSGTSLLLTMMHSLGAALTVALVLSAVTVEANRYLAPGRQARSVSTLIVGSISLGAALVFAALGRSLGVFFDWQRTEAVAAPGRGLWRPLLSDEGVFLGPVGSGEVQIIQGLVYSVIFGLIVLFWSRFMVRTVLDGQAWIRYAKVQGEPRLRNVFAALLVALAVALPLVPLAGKELNAQAIAHVVAVPPELADEVRVTTTINRNPFDQLRLIEVQLVGIGTEVAGISDEELFREELRFGDPSDGLTPRGEGAFTSYADFWSVERNDLQNSITLNAHREFTFFGLNTAIFVSTLLLLAATSQRIRKEPTETVVGRRAAGWITVVGAALIGIRLVASVIRLESVVGSPGERGSLFETFSNRATPIELDAFSVWFLPWNIAILVPIFALAIVGAKRITTSRRVTVVLAIAGVLATVVMGFQFGVLISDWAGWLID